MLFIFEVIARNKKDLYIYFDISHKDIEFSLKDITIFTMSIKVEIEIVELKMKLKIFSYKVCIILLRGQFCVLN